MQTQIETIAQLKRDLKIMTDQRDIAMNNYANACDLLDEKQTEIDFLRGEVDKLSTPIAEPASGTVPEVAEPETVILPSFRSERSVKTAQSRQRASFKRLEDRVMRLTPAVKRVLMVLVEHPDRYHDINVLAQRLDYSIRTVKEAGLQLDRAGLIVRNGMGQFTSYLDEHIEETYPDLSVEEMRHEIERIIDV